MSSDEDKKPCDEMQLAPQDVKIPPCVVPVKSSMEILSELFSTFHAEPPLIVKKECDEDSDEESVKKKKKSKKKRKHKDKKHKKKDKKRKRDRSSSSEESDVNLAKLLNKQEKSIIDKKVKTESTEFEVNINQSNPVKFKLEQNEIKNESPSKSSTDQNTCVEYLKKGKEIVEEGEVSDSTSHDSGSKTKHKKHKKRKHKSEHDKAKRKHRSNTEVRESHSHRTEHHSRSKDREREHSKYRNDEKIRSKSRENDKSKERHNSKDRKKSKESSKDAHKSKESDRYESYIHRDRDHKSGYKEKGYREDDFYKFRKNREDNFYKDDFYRVKDKDVNRDRDEKWFMKDRYRGYDDRERDRSYRERSNSREKSHIDKKKLLEIARKNAIQMMKSGNLPGALTLGPQAREKVIAAIKAGGKTIEELTDFCKTLSQKEELGELSSSSDGNHGSDSENETPFHHPFQIKDRPTTITMNIKNSVPLPVKTKQERTSELRMQFPVSSGQQHRKTEEWIPVTPKKSDGTQLKSIPLPPTTTAVPLPIEAPPSLQLSLPPPLPPPPPPPVPVTIVTASSVVALPGPQVFPSSAVEANVNIGTIVSQRLSAMRKLQENPNDVQALTQIYKTNKEMQSWAQSKQQPGQFTGSTGANILSQAELASGYQAWAKKALNIFLYQGSNQEGWLNGVSVFWTNCKPQHLCPEGWECTYYRKWAGNPEKV